MKNETFIKIQLVVLLFFLIQKSVLACNCPPYEPIFCDNITQTSHVIWGIVKEHPTHYSMTVEILENVNSEIDDEIITVIGADGINCGEGLGIFQISDTVVLAVEMFDYPTSDWWLSGCELRYLKYTNGMINGQITDEITSMPYDQFSENIFQCIVGVLSFTEEYFQENDLQVFPNPVTNILHIQNENSPILELEIFNSNGQLIFTSSEEIIQSRIINTTSFVKGIYFIRIRKPKGILTRKFLKI